MKITQKLSLLTFMPLVLFILLTTLSFSAITLYKNKTNEFVDRYVQRQEQLLIIHKDIGYSGGIHDFKNYIIRRSEHYYENALKKLNHSIFLMNKYLTGPQISELERAGILTLKSTISTYISKLKYAHSLPGKTRIKELDKLVKINDGPATKELVKIHTFLNKQKEIKKKKLTEFYNSTLIFLAISTGFILLLTFILSHYFSQNFIQNFKKIVEISDQLKNGVYEQKHLETYSKDELGQIQSFLIEIAHKFNEALAQLKRSNEHLQEFAYIASHDLQEPIKKNSNYVDLIKVSSKETLNEQSYHFLEEIKKNTLHMHHLVKALLTYSRLSHHDLKEEEWDLNLIVSDAIKILKEKIADKNANIQITKPFPFIYGERSLLVSVFQNILSNALKYSGPNRRPLIQIDYTKKSHDRILISITDNGLGFNEEYISTVLRPFGRLHGKEKGLGIGLASCKRIIDLHNGWLRVSSKEGEGSTFAFSLRFKQV